MQSFKKIHLPRTYPILCKILEYAKYASKTDSKPRKRKTDKPTQERSKGNLENGGERGRPQEPAVCPLEG